MRSLWASLMRPRVMHLILSETQFVREALSLDPLAPPHY